MMKTLGAQLEEARVNKGISIQEASERTKIRVSFLEAFEKNDFNIDLPEIYRKGFVKNYAELLDLDPDEIEAAYLRSQGKSGSKSANRTKNNASRENFGKLEMASSNKSELKVEREQSEKEVVSEVVNSPFRKQSESVEPKPQKTQDTRTPFPAAQPQAQAQPSNVTKLGGDKMIWAAVGVSFAALLVVVGFLAFLFKDDTTATTQTAANQPANNPAAVSNPATSGAQGPSGLTQPGVGGAVVPQQQMGLEAKGGDVHVILIDKRTGGTVFDQTIQDGDTVNVDKTGPMAIIFDKGSNIFVRLNDKLYQMPKSGPGRTAIP